MIVANLIWLNALLRCAVFFGGCLLSSSSAKAAGQRMPTVGQQSSL